MIEITDSAVVVVGSGLAGLTAALQAIGLDDPMPVTLLTKTATLAGGNSLAAQGGIAVAVGPGDHPEAHAADTVAAGAGLVDPAMAALLTRDGLAEVRRLQAQGLPFDCGPDGTPALGREAAHGVARILHAGGDATGRSLVTALVAQVLARPGLRVETGSFVQTLVIGQGRVCGVLAARHDRWIWHRAPRVVLATGGIGAAYRRTTNPTEATADGLALAARVGARLADLEFVQFHPTALAVEDPAGRPAPLLTEALRGAGAILVDDRGRRVMTAVHPDADLAPRDVVARAISQRLVAGDRVFLDLRPALAARPGAFPTALAACAEAGFDPFAGPVPVAPAAHYHMGGVATDADGRTSIPGLWACGEVACTGVHGANRLASNSLLEALAFGARVARDLRRNPALRRVPPVPVPPVPALPAAEAASAIGAILAQARSTLTDHAGLVRDAAGLSLARRRLEQLTDRFAALPSHASAPVDAAAVRRWGEAGNQLLAGRLIVEAALAREESRGAHARADFPMASARASHSSLTLSHQGSRPGAGSLPPFGEPACRIR